LYAKNRFRDVPSLAVSLFACVAASVMVLVPAAVTFPGSSPDLGEIAAVVSLGAIGTALAFFLYFGLIAEAGAGRAALCGYLIPPAALAWGALLLGEKITPAAIAGLALIFAGVALAGGERQVGGAPGAVAETPTEIEIAAAAAAEPKRAPPPNAARRGGRERLRS
jgi:drug/metabolite transporter (DMT)-like permease